MKQIGIGIHNYAGANHHLPGNHTPWGVNWYWSWMAFITPYIDQQPVWDEATATANYQLATQVNFDPWSIGSAVPGYPNAVAGQGNPALGAAQVWNICPADPRGITGVVINNPNLYGFYGVSGPIAFTMYMGNSGTHGGSGCCWDQTWTTPETPSYWGGGSPGPTFDGVIFVDSQVTFPQISDGTSNTLMVGERPPSQDLNLGWWFAGWGYNGTSTGDNVLGSSEIYFVASGTITNLNQATGADSAPNPPCNANNVGLQPGSFNNPCDEIHYWSNHQGGANFLYCDGSVHFLTYSANSVLPAMATRAGNEIFPFPDD